MKPQNWTEIVQLIIRDANHEPNESGRFKVLMKWRSRLAKEPHLFQLYQIDEIIREVRKDLKDDYAPVLRKAAYSY